MANKIEKIRDDLYVKKSWDGYSVVYPIKKDLEKGFTLDNINWKNFLFGGSYIYALKVTIIMLIIIASLLAYKHDTQVCRDFVKDIRLNCMEVMNTFNSNGNNTSDLIINFSMSPNLPNQSYGQEDT